MNFDFAWTDRNNNQDYVLADDVNSLAEGIIEAQQGITSVETKIKNEATLRNNADNALQEKIKQEANFRNQDIADLYDYVDGELVSEKEARENADTQLSNSISTLENNVSNLQEEVDQISTTTSKSIVFATFVIGTSTAGYTENDVDYLCNGTNDRTQIQSAINALPTQGGKIVLLEGTYNNISMQINVNKSNVTIEGMGRGATILQTSGANHIFNITTDNCKICSMTIKQSNNSKPGGMGAIVVSSGAHTIIRDVEVSGFAYGISAGGADMLIDSIYSHNNSFGIYSGNGTGSTNFRRLISNCTIKNNSFGIGIEGSYNHIFGNNIIDNDNGIWLANYGTPNNNQIQGNYIIRGTGQASDYTSSQYTIQVQSPAKNNYFSDNYIFGKNYVNSSDNTNTFVNNRYA